MDMTPMASATLPECCAACTLCPGLFVTKSGRAGQRGT